MRWRRVPPVHSPIALRSLLDAAAALLSATEEPVSALEREIASMFDAPEVVLTDSGTSALVLALESTVAAGDTVAMPGYACMDLVAAAIRARVQVTLYDLEPATMSPEVASVSTALQNGARAVVVAPLYGYPVDMSAISDVVNAHGVPLIEDAAQSAGSQLGDRRVGSYGDVSVLSFGRGKGTTGGSGGALLLRRAGLVERAVELRARLARRRRGVRDIAALGAQWFLARPELYAIPSAIPALRLGEMVYHAAGQPQMISAPAVSVLRRALSLDGAELQTRRRHAADLMLATARGRRLTPIRPIAGAVPGYLRLALLDAADASTEAPDLGVFRGYPITLDEHPETKRVLASRQQSLAGARVLRDRLLTVPTHSRVGRSDIDRLSHWLGSTTELLTEVEPQEVA